MAKATTTITFANGDQVTSTKLNQIISGFSLGADSVDATTMTLNSGVLSVGVITAANIGADAVTTSKIAAGSVTTTRLADLTVTADKLASDSVTNAKILDGTILFVKLGSAALATQTDMQSETASKLAAAATLKYHHGVSKAGAVLTMSDGTYAGAYNISGTATGTATTRTVTIPEMANTNYRVQFSQVEASGTTANAPTWTPVSTTTFSVTTGAAKVAFDVFGQLA